MKHNMTQNPFPVLLQKKYTHLPSIIRDKFATDLTITEINGARYYILPSGEFAPSISTIASYTKKDVIKEWTKKVGEEKANQIKNKAAARGTQLHTIIETYLKNIDIDDLFFQTDALTMFHSLRDRLHKIDNIRVQEQCLHSEILGIAGRCDCIAEYNGELTVIDFKQSNRRKKKEFITNYALQGTMYAMCYYEMTGERAKKVRILMAVENDYACDYVFNVADYIAPVIEAIKKYKAENPLEGPTGVLETKTL